MDSNSMRYFASHSSQVSTGLRGGKATYTHFSAEGRLSQDLHKVECEDSLLPNVSRCLRARRIIVCWIARGYLCAGAAAVDLLSPARVDPVVDQAHRASQAGGRRAVSLPARREVKGSASAEQPSKVVLACPTASRVVLLAILCRRARYSRAWSENNRLQVVRRKMAEAMQVDGQQQQQQTQGGDGAHAHGIDEGLYSRQL